MMTSHLTTVAKDDLKDDVTRSRQSSSIQVNGYNQHWYLATVAKDDANGKNLICSMDDVIKNICSVLIG